MSAAALLPYRWLMALLGGLLIWGGLALPSSSGQQTPPDTTVAPADTVQTPLREESLVPLGEELPGTVVDERLPALHPADDATDILMRQPGSFLYDFGAIGWPHGWSPYGLPPHRIAAILNGLPFEDLWTGRPRLDLLPIDLLVPLRTGRGAQGRPEAVYAQDRPLTTAVPLTEVRYRRANNELQSPMQGITVFHTQRRRQPLFGRPGVLDVLGSYGGRASDNEYNSSDLRRERRLYGRIQYQQRGFALELSNLHNRRLLGTHAGVTPPIPEDFGSIFNLVRAGVREDGARRRTVRNDLALTLRAPLIPHLQEPLSTTAFWTAQTFRYWPAGFGPVTVHSDRLGLRLLQEATRGMHRLRLEATATLDRHRLPGLRHRRSGVDLSLRDAFQLGTTEVSVEGGIHAVGRDVFPTAAVDLTQPLGGLHLFLHASRKGQPLGAAEQYGFADYLAPAEQSSGGALSQLRAGIGLTAGRFDVRVQAFAHRTEQPADLFAETHPDTVAAHLLEAPFHRLGLTAEAGLRRDADLGLYAHGHLTTSQALFPDRSSLHQRLARTVPPVHGLGRLGARLRLFRGDLELDAYLQGRFWMEMRSRTLHSPTGLLVVPPPGDDLTALPLGPDGLVDLYAEAGIRGATLFFGYQNALSTTQLQQGVLIVPVYPLPAQQFHFGIHWPIGG